MYGRDPHSITERIVRILVSRSGFLSTLMVVAYVAGLLGLGVAFVGGLDQPSSDLATVGILLLFVSFACLFYVSVTLLAVTAPD